MSCCSIYLFGFGWSKYENCCFYSYSHLRGLRLADFSYHDMKSVELLIDLDYYYSFLSTSIRCDKIGEPIALESSFGWVLSGSIILIWWCIYA